jgi:hypothetical protein
MGQLRFRAVEMLGAGVDVVKKRRREVSETRSQEKGGSLVLRVERSFSMALGSTGVPPVLYSGAHRDKTGMTYQRT